MFGVITPPLNASVRPHSMAAHVASSWSQAEAVRLARAIMSGDVGVLEGCIPLASIAHDVVPRWVEDPDFVVFGSVASEIDDLPFGSVRQHWSAEALAAADNKISRYAEAVREDILGACRNVIERFRPTCVDMEQSNGAV